MLHKLNDLTLVKVVARPSKICKSPYLADIKVFDDDNNIIEENVIAHSPALGCCGLIIPNVFVLCTKSNSIKNKSRLLRSVIEIRTISRSEFGKISKNRIA